MKTMSMSMMLVLMLSGVGWGQSAYVGTTPTTRMVEGVPLRIPNASFISGQLRKQREFREHDLVMVSVKSNWRSLMEGELERKRKMKSEYGITKWISFDGLNFNASEMSGGAPAIAGKADIQFKNEGTLERRDMVEFKITCEIESILENGVLYLVGTDTISIGEESKKIEFSGYARPEDISPDNAILSERIKDGEIREIPSGSVYDSYRRNWGQRAIDRLSPF